MEVMKFLRLFLGVLQVRDITSLKVFLFHSQIWTLQTFFNNLGYFIWDVRAEMCLLLSNIYCLILIYFYLLKNMSGKAWRRKYSIYPFCKTKKYTPCVRCWSFRKFTGRSNATVYLNIFGWDNGLCLSKAEQWVHN